MFGLVDVADLALLVGAVAGGGVVRVGGGGGAAPDGPRGRCLRRRRRRSPAPSRRPRCRSRSRSPRLAVRIGAAVPVGVVGVRGLDSRLAPVPGSEGPPGARSRRRTPTTPVTTALRRAVSAYCRAACADRWFSSRNQAMISSRTMIAEKAPRYDHQRSQALQRGLVAQQQHHQGDAAHHHAPEHHHRLGRVLVSRAW